MLSVRILVAGAALLLGVGVATAAPAQEAGRTPAGERLLDVIVVLDEAFAPGGHRPNRSYAAGVARDFGTPARHVYGSALVGFSARIPVGLFNIIDTDPRVRYVDLDAPVTLFKPPWCGDNPDHPACGGDDDGGGGGGRATGQVLPWGVDRVDADFNSNTGSGIHAYIIDTGIDSDHGDLQANLGNGYAVVECKGPGRTCKTAWDDDHGHGTHVAGTVGALDNDQDVVGVAPDVTLHAVKAFAKNGSASRSDIIDAVDWVVTQTDTDGDGVSDRAVVANLSFGGSGSKAGTCDSSGFVGEDAYHAAFCTAANAGVVFAAAAGNSGADAENSVPAAYDDAVITVSATKEGDDWASWSNWGDNTAEWQPDCDGSEEEECSAPVAIAAPGVDVLSTGAGGGTASKSGTSMAAPHVTGAAALYLSSNAQSAEYSAFTNTRDGLLGADEPTDGFSNTSGHPHDEDFLDAGSL